MSENLTPAVRFTGFTDDWEQRKLGELFIKGGSGGTPQSSNPEYYNGDINFLTITDVSNSEIYIRKTAKTITTAGLENSAAWIVPQEAISLAMYASVGKAGILKIDAATSQAFYNMIFEDLNLRDFVYQYLVKVDKENGWKSLISTGTQPNLNAHKVKDYEINIPTNLSEIKRVVSLLSTLDKLITLRQRKLELLQQLKKAMLQQMFPDKGESTPQVRFKGFNDTWEQRKLGELFSERSERSGIGELISVTINHGVVKATELDRKDSSSSDKSNYKKVEVGDIAYNSMRMWQGASGYSLYSGILSPAYTVIFPRERQNIIFWSYKLKTNAMLYKFRVNSQGLTSDTWNLKYPLFSKIRVSSPKLDEQIKIASLLSTLDQLITLHTSDLARFERLKKFLLQTMFV